jgi:hypothetical protein
LNAYSDELSLALTILLNGGLFVAAYRFVRQRDGAGTIAAICDAFLIYFLIQYAAVAIPGTLGIFNVWSMSAIALVCAAAMEISVQWQARRLISLVPTAIEVEPATASRKSRSLSYSPLPTLHASQSIWTSDHYILLACFLFTAGFLGCHAFYQRFVPPVATDGLVYHLPTAVQWLQTGRLGIYPSWYWNPAASYSPATGATFMAWLMAPAGNDVFVRYVQLPPLIFIFFLVVRMSRLMGADRATAGLIGVATCLSRPLFSEAVFQKDDLFVTAFIAAAVLSLADGQIIAAARPSSDVSKGEERARTPAPPLLSAWRVGLAFGFILASKYTALLACPIFLFMIDAPFRARWRVKHWITAIAIVIAMAFPWYLRNILLTGNPLYPVDVHLFGFHLNGLFATERDEQLRTAGGVWRMLAETYHSLPLPVIGLLITAWAWAAISGGKATLRDPLRRACLIGSPATIIIFLITSPHHEIRYLFPLIVLLFASVGCIRPLAARAIAFGPLAPSPGTPGEGWGGGLSCQVAQSPNPNPPLFEPEPQSRRPAYREREPKAWPIHIANQYLPPAVSGVVAVACVFTALDQSLLSSIALFAGIALIIAIAGMTLVYFQSRVVRPDSRHRAAVGASAVALFAIATYVFWHAYVEQYRALRLQIWAAPSVYPLQGPLWKWVDEQTPPDASLAYANTFLVYPYYGFNLTRHVSYAPVRRGLFDFRHFPRMGEKIPGDLLVKRMTQVMDTDADRETWMKNLQSIKADYLIVMKGNPAVPDLDPNPPELRFAREQPGRFKEVYPEDEAGVVYKIDWTSR